MRKLCNICCVLLPPVLIAAYAAAWRGLNLCGRSRYGPVAVALSAGALVLSLAVSEYVLRRFGDERSLLALGLGFWGVLLAPLVLSLAGVDALVLVLLLLAPWLPLGALLPGNVLFWLLMAISAGELLRFWLARRKLPKNIPSEENAP